MRVTALAGGVGAAKFLRGLVQVMDPSDLTIIGNVGDDATFHGLEVSPDLDIVAYTLSGQIAASGWGFEGDTTSALDQMRSYGIDGWFTLMDRDLGTHLARTTWLREGIALSEVTTRICAGLGISARLIPATDDRLRTVLTVKAGIRREFQEYFVKHRHEEEVTSVTFDGSETARPAPGVLDAIETADLILISPSNPVISVGPILAVKGIRETLRARRKNVTAISPIVEGAALKGPADRLLPLLGAEVSASGVAGLYQDFCSSFIVDERDPQEAGKVAALRMTPHLLDTVMTDPSVAARLAKEILAL
ncbi:MAG TPA: 2-phospho-L-lactate transferase [Actinomycetota bacterium]|nr:2-phospho-L-lactate transferase [Actinomycetota bacterium]